MANGVAGLDRQPTWHVQLQLAVLGVAVLAAASTVAWLLVRHHAHMTAVVPRGKPVLVSRAQLERFAATVDHPIYWAGPRPGYSYELTATSDGRIYVRYLPQGVAAGDRHPDFVVVGTYPQQRAYADLKRASERKGAVRVRLAHGGLAVFAGGKTKSVYFGYPRRGYQVEVYAPTAGASRRLVLGGTITPLR